MNTLGIVGETQQDYTELSDFFEKEKIRLSLIESEEQLSSIQGLLLIIESTEQVNIVFDWLLKVKNHCKLFVWIYAHYLLDHEEEVFLELGANGVFSEQDSLKSLELVIRNAFCKIKPDETKNNDFEIINPNSQSVRVNGEEVLLTRKEYQLFMYLYTYKNETISYKELLQELWSVGESKKYYLTNILFHLREKTRHSNQFQLINVRSLGYRLIMTDKEH